LVFVASINDVWSSGVSEFILDKSATTLQICPKKLRLGLRIFGGFDGFRDQVDYFSIFDYMRGKFLLLVWLIVFAKVQSVKAQNVELHKNNRAILGAAMAVGAGIFLLESFKPEKKKTIQTVDSNQSMAKVDSTVGSQRSISEILRSSRQATIISVASGVVGTVFINSGNLPLALVFTGVSAVSGVVAWVEKINWENQVTKKLEQL